MSDCADGPLVNFHYSVHTVAIANISNLILLSLVFYRSRSNSGYEGKFTVDGNTIGILNMGRFLLSHEVLRDYMHHFLLGRYSIKHASDWQYRKLFNNFLLFSCTLQTYHEVWIRRLLDTTEENRPSYNNLRYAWYSFLLLLDIDFAAGSICSECGPVPDIVVCDATTVAFRKSMVLRCSPGQSHTNSSSALTRR